MSKYTIAESLAGCGITSAEAFAGCQTVDQEFSRIKRSYLALVLVAHPDKGGDAEAFIILRDHWDVVRVLYDEKRVHASGFPYYMSDAGSKERSTSTGAQREADGDMPSWAWFEAAQHETMAPYRCEAARSAQSVCKTKSCEKVIAKGSLRCGALDEESGAYGRWHHIECWRIPASIWLALPDADKCDDAKRFEAALVEMQQLAFCGFTDLSPEHKQEFVAHCMNKAHYAKANKNSKAYNDGADMPSPAAASSSSSSSSSSSASASATATREAGASAPVSASPAALAHYMPPMTTQLASAGSGSGQFIMPRPGVNGAQLDAFKGKTFVLTGIFPEVGGGSGLNLGKDRVKTMIQSFGGRVTGSVSGKTDYVLVGASPGSTKVSAANARGLPTPDIQGLKLTLETAGASLELAPSARITSLSSGYRGNGIGFLTYDKPVAQPMLGSSDGGAAATGGFKAKKKRAAPKAPKAAASKAPKQPKKAPKK